MRQRPPQGCPGRRSASPGACRKGLAAAAVLVCLAGVQAARGGAPAPAGGPGRELRWTRLTDVAGARRVFAHPLDPDVAWCAAAAGLLATQDNGRTWAPVKSAVPDAVGEVTCVAVSTHDPQVICLGTDDRGLLLSSDGGGSWKRLGGDQETCASNHIEWVEFCPSDPSRRTLIATHGLAAPGMSLSRDLGAAWEVLGRDRFFGRFIKQRATIVAAASMAITEGKTWGIHRSGTDGLRWEETLRGIRPAAPAADGTPWEFFYATLDGAILHSADDGRSWRDLVRSEGSAWASLFFTVAPGERGRVLAAYDPHRQGLCLWPQRSAADLNQRHSRGLYVGPFVKSGAHCVPNANGTAYYVVMNNMLWVARWSPPADGPAVTRARCVPCAVGADLAAMRQAEEDVHGHIAAIAADGPPETHIRSIAASARTIAECRGRMAFSVQAQVEHPGGPGAIRAVTVDVSKLGGEAAAPLLDDGRHDDGKAGDGTYAALFPVPLDIIRQPDFRETFLLKVTAADASGAADSWPAVVQIPRGPMPASLMRHGWDSERAEGPVTVRWVHIKDGRTDEEAFQFTIAGREPWRAAWTMPGDGINCAGLQWLTFRIKGDPDQNLLVHLIDHHKIGTEGFFDEPHFSRPAALIAEGYLQAVTPGFQQVRIPIRRLLPKGVIFLRWHTAGIALSAPQGGKPGTYYVADVQVEP